MENEMENAIPQPESAATPVDQRTSTPRGRGRWIIAAVVLLLLLYLASPYYAFWRFTAALRSRDAAALQTAVDFPSLRKSMKQQLNVKLEALRPKNPKRQKTFDALSQAFGSQVLDSVVDAYLTPEGLAAFLADPNSANQGRLPAAQPATGEPPPLIAPETNAPPISRRLDWSRVHYAFFTGVRNFLVDVDGTKLRFRFTGLRWQLKALEIDISKLKI